MGDKRRWSTVRSYLCGNEFNSVLAEEDWASVKNSEATVTQPKLEESADQGDSQSQGTKEDIPKEKHSSTSTLFRQEDAAIIIQSAFRNFLVSSDWQKYLNLHHYKKIQLDILQENDFGPSI